MGEDGVPASETYFDSARVEHPAVTKTIDEQANHCFGCGTENPHGLHLEFEVIENDGVVTATSVLTMTRMQEGPPGYIHGGIIATLLDEAMSKLNRPLNVQAMTRTLTVEYLRPSPLFVPLRLIGRHGKREGRKLQHTAELQMMDGSVLAQGAGFFLVVDSLTRTQLMNRP